MAFWVLLISNDFGDQKNACDCFSNDARRPSHSMRSKNSAANFELQYFIRALLYYYSLKSRFAAGHVEKGRHEQGSGVTFGCNCPRARILKGFRHLYDAEEGVPGAGGPS